MSARRPLPLKWYVREPGTKPPWPERENVTPDASHGPAASLYEEAPRNDDEDDGGGAGVREPQRPLPPGPGNGAGERPIPPSDSDINLAGPAEQRQRADGRDRWFDGVLPLQLPTRTQAPATASWTLRREAWRCPAAGSARRRHDTRPGGRGWHHRSTGWSSGPTWADELLAALLSRDVGEIALTTALYGVGGFGKTAPAAWACRRGRAGRTTSCNSNSG